MIAQGATTLWEPWLPGDSSVHNSFLSIGEWFFSGLAGILPDPDAPGFRRIWLRPQPVRGLAWAKATFTSPYGVISSVWKVDGPRLVFEFQIPPNTTAIVRLPTATERAFQAELTDRFTHRVLRRAFRRGVSRAEGIEGGQTVGGGDKQRIAGDHQVSAGQSHRH